MKADRKMSKALLIQELERMRRRIADLESTDTGIENRLGTVEKQLTTLFDSISDIVFSISVEPEDVYRFTAVNSRFYEVTGLSKGQVIGKPAHEIFPKSRFAQLKAKFREAIERRKTIRWEQISQYPEGEKVGEVIITPIYGSDGNCTQLIGVAHDKTDYEKIQHELLVSNRKYLELLEKCNDGIVVLQDGLLKFANTQATQITGYSLEEGLGKSFMDFIVPQYREMVAENYRKRLSGEVVPDKYEIDIMHRNGGSTPVELNASLVEYEGRPAILAIIRDITERKEMENTLRQNEATLRSFFDSMGIMRGIVEIVDDTSVRYIIDNNVTADYLRLTPEAMRNKLSTELNEPTDIIRTWVTYYRQSRETQRPVTFEYLARRDGEEAWLSATVSYIGITAEGQEQFTYVVSDISERKRLEKMLRESEQNFRTSMNDSPLGIVINQTLGNPVYANKAALDLFGYDDIDEFKNTPLSKRHLAENIQKFEDRWKRVKEGRFTAENDSYYIIRKGGAFRFIEAYFKKIPWGGLDCIQVIFHDITEHKQAEDTLADETTRRRILVDQSRDGIVILDQNGNVYEANRMFAEMLGYTVTEVKKLNVLDWEYQFPPERTIEMIRTVDESGDHFESRHRRKDGSTYDVEISTNAVVFAGQKLILCVCRDITERKKAEEELLLRAYLLDNASDGISLFNRKGEYIYVNEMYCKSHGYTKEELIGMNIREMDQATTEEWLEWLEEELKETGVVIFETTHHRKDGSKLELEIRSRKIQSGGIEYNLSIERDITERKQAEESLRASELFNSSLLQNAPNPINVINPDTTIRYVNPALEKLTGYSAEELIGTKAPYLFWGEQTGERYLAILDEAMKYGMQNHERQFTRKNGETFWVKITNMPVKKNGELDYLLASWINITESKAANDALQESEERYRNLVQSSPIGVYIARKGRFIFVNPEFQKLTGYSETELLNMTSEEIIHPDDRVMVKKKAIDMLKGRRIDGYEFRVLTPDGKTRWAMETVTSIVYQGEKASLGSCMDITERKRIEEELRQSEGKLLTTIDSIPQGLMVTDFEGKITQVNKSAIQIYGCDSENDIIGNNGLDFAVEEDHQVILEKVLDARTSQNKTTFKYTAVKKTGERFPAEMSVAPIVDSSGETIGMVGVFEDITEQQKMQETLIITDRLASVGELAAGIAHELNNPLTGVIGFSDLLIEKEDIPDDIREDLIIINKEAVRASQVARHLLTFARKHPDEKVPTNINDVVNLVLELRAYEQRVNNIKVVSNLDKDLPDVLANDFQLQQVFINIIINAEYFMIETHGRGCLEITSEQLGDAVRVSVKDDGPGIAPEHINRIFDPFYTTKEVGRGTGLGLSICYGIITEHGGRIWVESKPDEGTTFIIELPLHANE